MSRHSSHINTEGIKILSKTRIAGEKHIKIGERIDASIRGKKFAEKKSRKKAAERKIAENHFKLILLKLIHLKLT